VGLYVAEHYQPKSSFSACIGSRTVWQAETRSHLFPNGKIVFQSFFISTTVQPFAWASSSALSR
jgi:hypothetical protein